MFFSKQQLVRLSQIFVMLCSIHTASLGLAEETPDVATHKPVKGIMNKNFAPTLVNQGHRFPTYHLILNDLPKYFTVSNNKMVQFEWNKKYPKGQQIFADTKTGRFIRMQIHHIHRLLYHKGIFKTEKLVINNGDEFLGSFHYGIRKNVSRKYTYVILPDGSFNFSETGKAVAVDLMSKHAVHSNAATSVVYAGEFTVMKKDGYHYLVIDNGSGTYAPDHRNGELVRLKSLLESNFPGLRVISQPYK